MEINKLTGLSAYTGAVPVANLSPHERAEQSQLIKAVHAVNESQFLGDSSELTFSLDPGTRRLVFKLIDKRTQEVIRQVPPEYILRLAEGTPSV